jgi:hypothetical protein
LVGRQILPLSMVSVLNSFCVSAGQARSFSIAEGYRCLPQYAWLELLATLCLILTSSPALYHGLTLCVRLTHRLPSQSTLSASWHTCPAHGSMSGFNAFWSIAS